MNIENITKDKRNLNKGTDKGKQIIGHSVDEYGYGRSIVVNAADEVIGGNHILDEAKKRNAKIRVIETDGTELVVVKRKDILPNSKEHFGLAIADNRAAQVNLDFDLGEMQDVVNEFEVDLEPMDIYLTDNNIKFPTGADLDDTEAMETNFDDFDKEPDNTKTTKDYVANEFPLSVVLPTKVLQIEWANFKKAHKLKNDTDAFIAIFNHAKNTF